MNNNLEDGSLLKKNERIHPKTIKLENPYINEIYLTLP